jgi:hypothetical protein
MLHPRIRRTSRRYVYYFNEDQRNPAGKLVSHEEAEDFTVIIARLPDCPSDSEMTSATKIASKGAPDN